MNKISMITPKRGHPVLEINFFVSSKYMLPGIQGSSKTNTPGPYNNLVTIHCQIYVQMKFHMVKGIDNAFDYMELCFGSRIISLKMGLFFHEITFITELPGSELFATQVFNRWQMGFSGQNLLLASANF